jgi:hypothetical protein
MSADSPAARAPTIVATSIRVPLRHGFPNRTSGSIETPGKTSISTTLALRQFVSHRARIGTAKQTVAKASSRLLAALDDDVHLDAVLVAELDFNQADAGWQAVQEPGGFRYRLIARLESG